jgi:hypothetical protein
MATAVPTVMAVRRAGTTQFLPSAELVAYSALLGSLAGNVQTKSLSLIAVSAGWLGKLIPENTCSFAKAGFG